MLRSAKFTLKWLKCIYLLVLVPLFRQYRPMRVFCYCPIITCKSERTHSRRTCNPNDRNKRDAIFRLKNAPLAYRITSRFAAIIQSTRSACNVHACACVLCIAFFVCMNEYGFMCTFALSCVSFFSPSYILYIFAVLYNQTYSPPMNN